MHQLNSIILYVGDVSKAAQFYNQLFGLTIKKMDSPKTYAELDGGTLTLGLVATSLMKEVAPSIFKQQHCSPSVPSTHISFTVDEIEDIYHKAITLGARELHAPQEVSWGGRAAFFTDIDGHVVELYQKK